MNSRPSSPTHDNQDSTNGEKNLPFNSNVVDKESQEDPDSKELQVASGNLRPADSNTLVSRGMVSDVQSNGKSPSPGTSSKVASENLQSAATGPDTKPAMSEFLSPNVLSPLTGIGSQNGMQQDENALELMFEKHNKMSSTVLERLIQKHNAEVSSSNTETDKTWAGAGPDKKPANNESSNIVARDHFGMTALEQMISVHEFENSLERSQIAETDTCSWISSEHCSSDLSDLSMDSVDDDRSWLDRERNHRWSIDSKDSFTGAVYD